MDRNSQYAFVDTDTDTLLSEAIASFEGYSGLVLSPASPERLFLQWAVNALLQERVLANYIGNQNIPSRATGDNLDGLGELFYFSTRPEAQAAKCTVRFTLSQVQETPILIPQGSRVTDKGGELIWETESDQYVPEGESFLDAGVVCQTVGTVGNGYAVGQISVFVDVFPYIETVSNITATEEGADRATDDEFYTLMRLSQDAYSTAGAMGGYEYHAKKVSTEIGDVVVNSPSPGEVAIFVLMTDGTPAGEELKSSVLDACSADSVRPLTDFVTVCDPVTVGYNIDLTYYIPSDSTKSATAIATEVEDVLSQYIQWQDVKLGRDINPSYLIGLLMGVGVKRVEVREPLFTPLSNGSDNTTPERGCVGGISVTSGGFEDE